MRLLRTLYATNVASSVFFFLAEDGIRDLTVTGVQTCALPIWGSSYMFIKVGVRDFSPAAMVELRLLLAGAVLVSFVAARRGLRAVRPALAPGAFVGIRSEERRVGTACDYSDVRINNVYIAYWL